MIKKIPLSIDKDTLEIEVGRPKGDAYLKHHFVLYSTEEEFWEFINLENPEEIARWAKAKVEALLHTENPWVGTFPSHPWVDALSSDPWANAYPANPEEIKEMMERNKEEAKTQEVINRNKKLVRQITKALEEWSEQNKATSEH